MLKWFRDVVLIPLIIMIAGGFAFMIWGAWYSGVKWHSPFSSIWLKAVFCAPVPLWIMLITLGVSAAIGWNGYIAWRKFHASIKANDQVARVHDERIFNRSEQFLPEGDLMEVLDLLQTDDSYRMSKMDQIRSWMRFFSETGNQFINSELSSKRTGLSSSLDELCAFTGRHFFVYPNGQLGSDVRLCMYPELNIDRNGTGTPESMARYDSFQKQLDAAVGKVRANYAEYRRAVKVGLYV